MNSRLSDLPLQAKLAGTIAALVLGLSAALLVELPRAMDAQSMGWITSRSLGLGRLLASALEAPVDFEDRAAAERALAGLAQTRGAVHAVLLMRDGSRLAAWPDARVRPIVPAGEGEAAAVVDGLLRVRVPVVTRAGPAAALVLAFDLDELEERRRDARGSVLATALVFLVVGLGAALAIGALLARPIQRMTGLAQRVAAGESIVDADLPLGRRDEVGRLAHAFQVMLERLLTQQAQINRINDHLAEQVRERTKELGEKEAALAQLERTQEQLVMADRRISVGRLAAGVAHEINNPLAFLGGNLTFLAGRIPEIRRMLDDGGPASLATADRALAELSSAVADGEEGARRVVHIVKGLRTFSRDDEDTREVLPLERPLEAAIGMAWHEIKHRANLVRLGGAAPPVVANEVRLSQVLLNLLINAAHAIPEGARDAHEIRVGLGVDPRGRAVVEVSDTGCGMTPEILARIFDPFFTTKPVGVGSGLGLPISRNIVARLGGEITVESAPGRGSTFRVVLPAAPSTQAEPPATTPPPRPAAAPVRGLRLLVVDDEPLIGQLVARALREADVVRATSGREALTLVEEASAAPFDRVLCDVMMPEMSGPELYAELSRRDPRYHDRFVFMTGGAFTDGARSFVERYPGPVLDKPLDPELLRRVLA